jgi:hypothetical protein
VGRYRTGCTKEYYISLCSFAAKRTKTSGVASERVEKPHPPEIGSCGTRAKSPQTVLASRLLLAEFFLGSCRYPRPQTLRLLKIHSWSERTYLQNGPCLV